MADDARVRVTVQPDGTALVWLPSVAYLDTQAGPVEIGLDREVLVQLHQALGEHLGADSRTEYGARFEGGEVMLRPDREFAMNTVRAVRHRGGTSALMVRQITTTNWTEAEEEANA